MKVVLPGGSGQVGKLLARAFEGEGHEVVVLSRAPGRAPLVSDGSGGRGRRRTVVWDARTRGAWVEEIDGADLVINLAGRSVDCRYTPQNRHEILTSRVDSTRAVGEAIARATRPPGVWLQASTATIYAHRYDAVNDDVTGRIGGDEPGAPDTWRFSIEVAKAWERALDEAVVPHTRKVALRAAMVMSPDRGGVFDVLLRLVRFGLGGSHGNGRQFVSWVHEADFVAAVRWIAEHPELSGPINVASPGPLPNAEFLRGLRRAWGRRFGLPARRWMIEIGAFLLRTESELILKSRRVVSRRLQESGFAFSFPLWPAAAEDLCARWRRSSSGR